MVVVALADTPAKINLTKVQRSEMILLYTESSSGHLNDLELARVGNKMLLRVYLKMTRGQLKWQQ